MEKTKTDKYAELKKKVLWTVVYFLLFMIGRNIPIPHLSGSFSGGNALDQQLLHAANIASGGDFFTSSLFTLGLGPWMGAAILWRFLLIDRLAEKKKLSKKAVNYARSALTIILAVIQSIAIMSNYEIEPLAFGPFSGRANAQVMIILVMVTGVMVLTWLANQNEENGFGGMTLFVMYQIMISSLRNFSTLTGTTNDTQQRTILILILVTCVIVLILSILSGDAELRLHVNKISIDSGYTGRSYMPIKLNPAGSSPIMYGLTLMVIPQYVVHVLATVFPQISTGATTFLSLWNLSSPIGFVSYLVLLFILTIFFGLFTVSPKDISKQMKKSGDYFDLIPPGTPTRRFLRDQVVVLSVISGIFLVILTGLPLYFLQTDWNLSFLFMLPGSVMIFVSLYLIIREEIADILIGTKYSSIFFDSKKG